MAASNSAAVSVDGGHMVPGFAKLQGENFCYIMQKYSIILGRSTETCKVDVDISKFGGERRGPHVSHHHARIFYDFHHHHFALEVLGKDGCGIREVSYLPGTVPIKLNSQDLIEIGGKKFYFLLPTRSIFATLAARDYRGHSYADDYGRSNDENGCSRRFTGELDISNSYGTNADPAGTHDDCEDQLLLEEEKDAVSSLVDLCSPGEWVPMEKFYAEVLERFGKNWRSAMVKRYLSRKDGSGSSTGTEGRRWRSLLPLLMKYPKHFAMSTVTRGDVTSDYVQLVSPVSSGDGP